MAQLLSTQAKVIRLVGLLGTEDLNEWEEGFVKSMEVKVLLNKRTLGESELDKLDEIHNKYFA
jgi:hypothetical protein